MADFIIKKLLYDILIAIETIEQFLGTNKNFDEYSKNKMMRNAIERNLEIIGEATSKLLKIDPNIKITNARRIVDARNKIIHAYDEIEDETIWAIIINQLPVLRIEIVEAINS